MPLFRFDNSVVLFIHVPKTGGSSIEQAMRRMGGREALLASKGLDYSRCTPQHMPADILSLFVPKNFYDMSFAVVRDPCSRLISEFKMRREGRKRRNLPLLSFAEWVDMAFARYQKNPYVFDNHIRPQTYLIPEDVLVFRQEGGLEQAVAAVADHVGCPMPKLPRLRQGDPAPVSVTAETAMRIREFYYADYARFGYKPAEPTPKVDQDAPPSPA
ncbi:MAG: sulfotransferase family 2 domain-containing protein [Pseudomonadota bacterium]